MDKTTLPLRVFGIPLSVEVPVERHDLLREQWSWCLAESSSQRTIAAIGGGELAIPEGSGQSPVARFDVENDPDGHDGDYRLTTAITGRAISLCSGQLFMLHAAGIADMGSNRVAGLVAPSGTGKTTATQRLCATSGFGYVTDESLVFNENGHVLPYPKPLSVIVPGSTDRRKSQHGPDELEFTAPPPGPLQLGPIIILERVEGAQPPRLERLSTIEGLKAVLPQSSAMPLVADCLHLTAEIARHGGGFHRLTYSEIEEAAPLLQQSFLAEEAARDWVHVPGNWPTGADAPSPFIRSAPFTSPIDIDLDDTVIRGSYVDALLDEDATEGLVLVGDLPMHLRGIGAALWAQLAEPTTVRSLVAFCIERFGDHPDAPRLVRDALSELARSHVIVTERA